MLADIKGPHLDFLGAPAAFHTALTTGVRRGVKRAFTPWKLGLRKTIFWKTWSRQFNSD